MLQRDEMLPFQSSKLAVFTQFYLGHAKILKFNVLKEKFLTDTIQRNRRIFRTYGEVYRSDCTDRRGREIKGSGTGAGISG